MTKHCFLTALLAGLGLQLVAQAPVALVNARILTMTDAGTIERGTIVVRDGRIAELGADVRVPPGAHVVDVAGGTVMPGLVHAWSRAGTAERGRGGPSFDIPPQLRGRIRGGSRGGGGSNAVVTAATKVSETLYARQDVFGELLREGVTTLVVRPEATGFPGLAARVAPDAGPDMPLTIADEVYVVVDPAPSPKAGKAMKDALDKAAKVLEERKKPKEAPKPEAAEKPKEGEKAAEKGEGKEGEKPSPTEKPKEGEEPEKGEKPAEEAKPKAAEPEKKPEPKKDPNLEVLADLLDGKRKAFLRVSSAMEIQHYRTAVSDHTFPAVVVADRIDPRSGLPMHELEWLKKAASIVLMAPSLEEVPNTRVLVNPAAELAAAGLQVGFVLGDDADAVHGLMFDLMELVRAGLPADTALRGVTAVPAQALGLADEVGTVAEGRRADLLVFSGDPLDPTSRLRHVFLAGREVDAHADR